MFFPRIRTEDDPNENAKTYCRAYSEGVTINRPSRSNQEDSLLTSGLPNLNPTTSGQEGQLPFGFLRPSARQTWQPQYEPYLVLNRNAASDPRESASGSHCRLISRDADEEDGEHKCVYIDYVEDELTLINDETTCSFSSISLRLGDPLASRATSGSTEAENTNYGLRR